MPRSYSVTIIHGSLIADGSITTQKLANGAITRPKIAPFAPDIALAAISRANFFNTGLYPVTQITRAIGQIDVSGMRFRFDVTTSEIKNMPNLYNSAYTQALDGDLDTATPAEALGTTMADKNVKVDAGAVGRYFVAAKLTLFISVNLTVSWSILGSVNDVTYTTLMSGSRSGGAAGGTFTEFYAVVAHNIRYLKLQASGGGGIATNELAAWRID